MSPALPVVTARVLIRALLRLGFSVVRQKGSHVHLRHAVEKARRVTIPYHNRDIAKKTLLSILKQAKLSVEELLEAIR